MTAAADSQAVPIAVDAAGAARMFSCSVRHWRQLDVEGKVPVPVRLNRSVRWIVSDLNVWAIAGCPTRLTWEALNKNARRAVDVAAAGGNRGRQHDSSQRSSCSA